MLINGERGQGKSHVVDAVFREPPKAVQKKKKRMFQHGSEECFRHQLSSSPRNCITFISDEVFSILKTFHNDEMKKTKRILKDLMSVWSGELVGNMTGSVMLKKLWVIIGGGVDY